MLKTVYAPLGGRPWHDAFDNDRGLSRQRVLDIPTPYKTTLSLIAGFLSLLAAVTVPLAGIDNNTLFFASFFLIAVFTFVSQWMIWCYVWATTSIVRRTRGITDEVERVVATYKRLLKVRSLLPEGAGSRERIDEYGRLAFLVFQECARLPQGMEGRDKNFYRIQNQIQTELKRLSDSGDELVDLVSTRRAENTLDSVKHLGITEYAEHVSLETMAYRSLTTGEEPEPAPKKKRPDHLSDAQRDLDEANERLNTIIYSMKDKGRH